MDTWINWIGDLPALLVYTVLGLGAGVENVFPALPADTFVLLGGFLSALRDGVEARWVFLATWGCNVVSAMLTYHLGRTHGPEFFQDGWGRRLLNPAQMERMRGFYRRWGTSAVFFTRFLPGFRAVVPVFAGVSRQSFLSVFIPVAVASGLWYGALVVAGVTAGRNLDRVRALFADVNTVLLVVALLCAGGVAFWWWRTRHDDQ